MSNAPAPLIDLRSLDRAALEAFVTEELGERRYRAKQLYRWIHHRFARSFEEMTDIAKPLRETLGRRATLAELAVETVEISADGTRKYAFRTPHGDLIESVFVAHASGEDKHALCISSQVGCAMGCAFCLTARLGFRRNLTPGEIVAQVGMLRRELGEAAIGANVVLMGMGEPLANYDNLLIALRLLTDDEAYGLSTRRVTVSTCGLVPQIEQLGRDIPVQLAISLNATTDELRDRLMPVNRTYPLDRLLATLREYPMAPRRRITVEYVMLGGLNDSLQDARRLLRLLNGVRCKVNLIPWNAHSDLDLQPPTEAAVTAFQEFLFTRGMRAQVRKKRGDDISAACGQLGRALMEGAPAVAQHG